MSSISMHVLDTCVNVTKREVQKNANGNRKRAMERNTKEGHGYKE
jgi:hypothetical protein